MCSLRLVTGVCVCVCVCVHMYANVGLIKVYTCIRVCEPAWQCVSVVMPPLMACTQCRLAALAFIVVIQLWVFFTFLRHQLDRSGGEKPKDSSPAPKPIKKSTEAKKSPKPQVSPKVETSSKPGKTGKVKDD